MNSAEIPEGLRQVLRGIGLPDPDLEVPLHRKLVEALQELGPAATLGQRVVAMRWIFNWELTDAGEVFARAKANYERLIDRETVRQRADAAGRGEKLSRIEAEQIVKASDAAYEQHLAYLLAEQRERAMRKFLDTLDASLDNHRTDRADLRAGDRAHAQGYGGGA